MASVILTQTIRPAACI